MSNMHIVNLDWDERDLFQSLIDPIRDQALACPGMTIESVIRGFVFSVNPVDEKAIDSLEAKGLLVSSGGTLRQFELTEAGVRQLARMIKMA